MSGHAYILIQTDVGHAAEVTHALTAVPGVISADDVNGPYDVIVRAEARSVDALGTDGLPFESAGEDAEDDDATTWNIDYLYDVGLMIGGGSNNIQKNIISERGLDMPREPKVARA